MCLKSSCPTAQSLGLQLTPAEPGHRARAVPLMGSLLQTPPSHPAPAHAATPQTELRSGTVRSFNTILLKTRERLKYKVFVSELGRRCCTENSRHRRLLTLTHFYIQLQDTESEPALIAPVIATPQVTPVLTLLPPTNLNGNWVPSQTSKPRAPFTGVHDPMSHKAPAPISN